MAVELIRGYGRESFAGKVEENAVQEAASAGLQSVEKLIRLLSQRQQEQQQQQAAVDIEMDCKAVADVAVNKFKKVISLLDRTRTGHARFRRAPVVAPTPTQQQLTHEPEPPIASTHHQKTEDKQISASKVCYQKTEEKQISATKVYYPTPIQRLPPLPQSHHQMHHHHNPNLALPKNGSLERKDSTTTINFSSSPPISAANSFMSSLTGRY
ncbi:hypothetical protein L1049_026530 [Liquidambar formosana]|uniref:Uncharacterized protein n=1 Tax=Liquidambar formosana TaxID=63359 RepID=A0AAP0R5I9_LIQFO